MVSGEPQLAHSLIAALVAADRSAVGGALVALVIAVGLGAAQAQEEAGLPLPDGASLAVLPLVNMSTERDLQHLIALIERAIRLNPFSEGQDRTFLGFALTSAGRHGEAIDVSAAERELGIRLSGIALAYWTAALTESGRTGEAEALAKEILARFPTFTVTFWDTTLRYMDAAEADHHLNALKKAGLPN